MKFTVALIIRAQALDNVVGKAFLQQEAAKVTVAAFGDDGLAVPPISTTMQCVVNLTIQYFLVYTCLAVVRTMNQVSAPEPASTSVETPGRGGWFGGASKKASS